LGAGETIGAAAVTAVVIEYRLSEDAIEKMVEGAKRVLFKHGARIRHLGRTENVVIALKIEGDAATDHASTAWLPLPRYSTTPGAAIVTNSSKTKTVILRVPKQALEGQKAGDLDEAAFMKLIEVTEY
jgi:hypothetical protein